MADNPQYANKPGYDENGIMVIAVDGEPNPQYSGKAGYNSSGWPIVDAVYANVNYVVTVYGDSLCDEPDDYLAGLGLYNRGSFTLRRVAVAGRTLTDIKAAFDADFPGAGSNMVVIAGIINDVVNGDTLAASIAAIDAMAGDVLAANVELVIIGGPPIGNDIGHSPIRQAHLEDFNAHCAAKYSVNYINPYPLLVDPGLETLANDYYLSASNLHPEPVGGRKVEELFYGKLSFAGGYPVYSEDANNRTANPRDLSLWTGVNVNPSYNGLAVVLADGTIGASAGIVANLVDAKHGYSQTFAALVESSVIDFECVLRPGNLQWAFIEYTNNAGDTHTEYVDIINLVKGASGGTGAFVSFIEKYAPGWVKYRMQLDSGVGGANNVITVSAAAADLDNTYIGNARAPGIFVDMVQAISAAAPAAPWIPADVAHNAIYQTDVYSAALGEVTEFTDQSVNLLHMNFSHVSENLPTEVLNAQNGHPALGFTAASLQAIDMNGSPVVTAGSHMWILVKVIDTLANSYICCATGGASAQLYMNGGGVTTTLTMSNGIALTSTDTIAEGEWALIGMYSNGLTSELQINRGVPVVGDAGATYLNGLALGKKFNEQADSHPTMQVLACYPFTSKLSPADEAELFNYVNTEYGLAL